MGSYLGGGGAGGGGGVYSEPFDFIGHSSYFLVDNI